VIESGTLVHISTEFVSNTAKEKPIRTKKKNKKRILLSRKSLINLSTVHPRVANADTAATSLTKFTDVS